MACRRTTVILKLRLHPCKPFLGGDHKCACLSATEELKELSDIFKSFWKENGEGKRNGQRYMHRVALPWNILVANYPATISLLPPFALMCTGLLHLFSAA